jgi:YidC/Oxa1 family membrane protein insertase
LDLNQLWNAVAVVPLMAALKLLADLTNSGGLAIILMTLIIKTVLLPLSLKQTQSMKAMQAIQPEIAALKKKVKDKEKLTQETMRLYKERGVNPAAGCLPMLPMMIVLFALYGALIQLAQCDPARDNTPTDCDRRFAGGFLWLEHLDKPDLVFSVPDTSDKRITIQNPANPDQRQDFLAPSAPGAKREYDDPWHPGGKIYVEVPQQQPDRFVVTYSAQPGAQFEVPNPPTEMKGALPRIPGFDIPIPFLLPILMAVTQYFSSKMMAMPTSDPQQQTMNNMMTIMMPGMMLFWGATFPAGLVLYWLVSNLCEMARLYFTMGPKSAGLSMPHFGSSGPPADDDGNGARSVEELSRGDISGDGSRANGRSGRARGKRGKRSGRRR